MDILAVGCWGGDGWCGSMKGGVGPCWEGDDDSMTTSGLELRKIEGRCCKSIGWKVADVDR